MVDGGLLPDLAPRSGPAAGPAAREVPVTFRQPSHPIAYGYGERTSVLRDDGPLWSVAPAGREHVVLVYGPENGPRDLRGEAAIVDVPVGRGRVILFTFNPLDRYLNHSDFRLLYNAMLFGPVLASRQRETAVPVLVDALAGYGKVNAPFAFSLPRFP